MGEVDYSPEVSETAETLCAWRLALKVAEGKNTKRKNCHTLQENKG